jgi:hypothetical protein
MRKVPCVILISAAILVAGCSGGGGSTSTPAVPSGAISVSPASNPAQPINLSNGNLYPGGTAILTASEAGYSGGFTAVAGQAPSSKIVHPLGGITGGYCISITPVAGTTNKFTAASIGNCGQQNAPIAISDSLGHTATSYVTNI